MCVLEYTRGAGAGVEWVLRRSVREVLEVVQRVR